MNKNTNPPTTLAATKVTKVRGDIPEGTGEGVGMKVDRSNGENNVARGYEVARVAAIVLVLAGSCRDRQQGEEEKKE